MTGSVHVHRAGQITQMYEYGYHVSTVDLVVEEHLYKQTGNRITPRIFSMAQFQPFEYGY